MNDPIGLAAVTCRPRIAGRPFDAQKRREREANVLRIKVLGRVVARMAAADGDQRHAQAVGVIVVLQALDLVVADEFQAIDVFGMPAGAVHARRRTSRCCWRW